MFNLESWILTWKIFGDHEDWTGFQAPAWLGKGIEVLRGSGAPRDLKRRKFMTLKLADTLS